jgi:hypothetical protein
MPSEITTYGGLTASKGGVSVAPLTRSKTLNMAASAGFGASHTARGAIYMQNTLQNLNTSGAREAIDVGDVDIAYATGHEYLVEVWNRHATATILIEVRSGAATYDRCGKLRPGEVFKTRAEALDTNGYFGFYATPSADAVQMEVIAVEAGDPAA